MMVFNVIKLIIFGILITSVSGCEDKTSPYTLDCRYSDDQGIVSDRSLMHMASNVIYDDLESTGRLGFLGRNAGPHRLYDMYLSSDETLRLEVSRRAWSDPARIYIYVTFDVDNFEGLDEQELEKDRVFFSRVRNSYYKSYDIDYQDCGPVSL